MIDAHGGRLFGTNAFVGARFRSNAGLRLTRLSQLAAAWGLGLPLRVSFTPAGRRAPRVLDPLAVVVDPTSLLAVPTSDPCAEATDIVGLSAAVALVHEHEDAGVTVGGMPCDRNEVLRLRETALAALPADELDRRTGALLSSELIGALSFAQLARGEPPLDPAIPLAAICFSTVAGRRVVLDGLCGRRRRPLRTVGELREEWGAGWRPRATQRARYARSGRAMPSPLRELLVPRPHLAAAVVARSRG